MNADDRVIHLPPDTAHDTEPATSWPDQAGAGGTIGNNRFAMPGDPEGGRGQTAESALKGEGELTDLRGEQPEPQRPSDEEAAMSLEAAGDVRIDETAGFAGAVQATVTAFLTRLDRIERRLAAMDDSHGEKQASLTETLASLERQIGRAGREQFKASTLAEAQRDQLQDVLETLQQTEVEREARLAEFRESAGAAARQARLAMARSIIPAIDGLDDALRSGQRLAAPDAHAAPPRLPWIGRGNRIAAADGLRADMKAWLAGLAFVRERLLDVLAAEGISLIPAEGEPFDPEIHLALEVSKAGEKTPPGTISAVIRQGYRHEQGILRPAEVVVARADDVEPGRGENN